VAEFRGHRCLLEEEGRRVDFLPLSSLLLLTSAPSPISAVSVTLMD
jgi:hypothetical protein